MTEQAAQADSPAGYPRAGYLLLAGLTFFWGINWPFMKIALTEIPIWWFRTSCVLAGAIGLLSIAILSGNSLKVQKREIVPLLACTLFSIVGWQLFSGYGLTLMPAGRASIIAFTMPVWAAILSVWFLGEEMTRYKLAGLACGLAGLAVLMGPAIMVWHTAPLGAFFMLGAAMSWGLGTVLFKRFDWNLPVVSNVGLQLLLSAIPISIGAILLEAPPDLTELSDRAMFSALYVYLFPMIFCMWAYFKVVKIFPATVAAVGTLMIPVIGVFSGAVVLSEKVGFQEISAMILICLALACVMVLPNLNKQKQG
ncbi:MAG: DMT family transporter [Hyphomicrobiales bacterium]